MGNFLMEKMEGIYNYHLFPILEKFGNYHVFTIGKI